MSLASKYQNDANRRGISAACRARDDSGGREDFIDQTLATWQPLAKRQLTREDGREIIENMTGFFRILLEWDRAERAAKNPKMGS
jgi:hypothetical protein